ncbi:MAG TPA: hypothetical protein VFV66_27845 [Nonomuraea sp.]|nr:hypothetical protein [Nonomuraea sp.]
MPNELSSRPLALGEWSMPHLPATIPTILKVSTKWMTGDDARRRARRPGSR